MEVKIAKYSGYCFGVQRALGIAESTIEKYKTQNKRIFTLGPIIHNPGVVKELEEKGITVANSSEEIDSGDILVIRSHGTPPQIIKELETKGVIIRDATCPFVKRAQEKAKLLSQKGYFVVIVGNKDHPEVKGIKESVENNNFAIVESEKDIKQIPPNRRIGIIAQTTQTMEKLMLVVNKLLDKEKEILTINTICNTTKKRQASTQNLAKKVDLMLIVGGKNSANTTHLADISRNYNPKTYQIESYKEINKKWLEGVKKVGVSGGASTPMKDVLEVKEFIESLY